MRNIIKHQINAWIKKVDVSSKAEYQRLLDAVMNECLYVDQHLDRDTFAARMSLSRHNLNKVLRENTNGLSFPQWLNGIRIEKACELLKREKRKTINEVAWAVGLTPDNLRRLFRQQIGITPTECKMKN